MEFDRIQHTELDNSNKEMDKSYIYTQLTNK